MIHEKAGKAVETKDLISVQDIYKAYYEKWPSMERKEERTSFGTSGHRGEAEKGTFTEAHVAAITQAICDGRKEFGATGPLFVGHDTHALSEVAFKTVREVLAGNGIETMVDKELSFVPTPSISRAILRYNESHEEKGDGIIITPSHNPPSHGGIKYNPTHGGPAEGEITSWIEKRANAYLEGHNKGVLKASLTEDVTTEHPYDYKGLYVKELASIIDMEKIAKSSLSILINALGGSGSAYWNAIKEEYDLPLTIINDGYDPTFSFMTYDYDGQIRMDCSSPYAMATVMDSMDDFHLAVGNDPDYDRYGIVTKEGLLGANDVLLLACNYLFRTRSWQGKGIGKTIVVTELVDRLAKERGQEVLEVPVGFKFFVEPLTMGRIGLCGEESAGASFLTKEGKVWTTDKDGIIMALLGMEMMAHYGKSLFLVHEELAHRLGKTYNHRMEAPISFEGKEKLKQLSRVDAKEVGGSPILSSYSQSPYGHFPMNGLKICTEKGWLVARPSGTEALYKVYGESYESKEHLERLLREGVELVNKSIKE